MNKIEIQTKVHELLAAGTAKSDVFAQLTGQGVKDSRLAYFIASYADPNRYDAHERKVNILITLMCIQALLLFVFGFSIGASIGPNAKWIVASVAALIPLLFAWGFYTNRVGAYNAYIVLTLVQFHNSFNGFTENPIATSVGIAINLSILAYVWYVRQQLFPDFAFITPKKIKGEYIFSG